MFWVYAIRNSLSNRVYIGQTNDVKRRLEEHNRGIVRSTRVDRPWELVALQKVESMNQARWIEKSLKDSHLNTRYTVEGLTATTSSSISI